MSAEAFVILVAAAGLLCIGLELGVWLGKSHSRRRIDELLDANNREVERRRDAERRLSEALTEGAQS